jgi:hypothetical protein
LSLGYALTLLVGNYFSISFYEIFTAFSSPFFGPIHPFTLRTPFIKAIGLPQIFENLSVAVLISVPDDTMGRTIKRFFWSAYGRQRLDTLH